jgi:uncharacterized protein YecT (DUF1311 family)
MAQLQWIKYRDLNAEFEASLYRKGSINAQIKLDALARMTKERTRELDYLMESDFEKVD